MSARQPIGHHATGRQALERAAQLWSDHKQAAAFDDPEDDLPPDADLLIDVSAEMRILWRRALSDLKLGAPTPQLPTVEANRLVMVPVTVLVGTLMDLHTSIDVLCRGLADDRIDSLHLKLREAYVEGYAQSLANIGWTA